MSTASPNPLAVAWSIARVLRKTRPPSVFGRGEADHSALRPALESVKAVGLDDGTDALVAPYLAAMAAVEPATLTRPTALAFWLNVYNAGALQLASQAAQAGADSVLRVPGAFDRPMITIAGEGLSLDAIEHGKIRRFGDPRIHGALICGSVSCPTLRAEPYTGANLEAELEQQMRAFLAGGGAHIEGETAMLSRVFLWYGGDFARPHRMPTWLPARRAALLDALVRWDERLRGVGAVKFQPYDWGLRCAVG